MNSVGFTVETSSILKEAYDTFRYQHAVGAAMGIAAIKNGLVDIAKRVIELNDPELIAICQRLCLIATEETREGDSRG